MTTIQQLKEIGFSDNKIETPRRLIVSVAGREKSGKTHFACTAPEPILFFNIDVGTEGVVGKFQDGLDGHKPKQILIYDVRLPKSSGSNKDVYGPLWLDVKSRLSAAYGLGRGTVVIDTATEAWELARLAHFGKLTQVMPHNYVEVNNEWREMLRMAYDSDMNTVLIHKQKAKYVNNVRTSEWETAGFGEIGYLVQANFLTYRDDTDGGPAFNMLIQDCRQNPNLSGQVLRGPMVDFGFILDLVHSK